jgi:hypothetical protein
VGSHYHFGMGNDFTLDNGQIKQSANFLGS